MKNSIKILIFASVSLVFSGCSKYNNAIYEQNETIPPNVFGSSEDILNATDGKLLTEMSWREFFTDPLLQKLIDHVLDNNTDLNSARIAVEKSEIALNTAKLAYLPSLNFAPQGSLGKFGNSSWSKTYNLPLQMSVDLDVFGSITNKKRAQEAVLLQAQIREEAIRSNLISITAQQYYMLQLLDRQLEILTMTDSLWNASLEIQRVLWEYGKVYSTSVNQMESSYLNVKTQIVDTRRNIRSVENSLCRLILATPQHIERHRWGSSALTDKPQDRGQRMFDTQYLKIGVPSIMLERRPDIRMANHAMEEAFYNTQAARAAFFPNISLSGTLGWTNSAGSMIVNPGKLLLSAVGQLTQPIFSRGKLKANLKMSLLTEEELQSKYVQTVIDAGNQVNEAMADCQAAREKHAYYHRQVEVLYDAYTGTHYLMENGKANYLEVLTAQESLLSAQLNEAMNMYNGAQAIIALYIALGGGTK